MDEKQALRNKAPFPIREWAYVSGGRIGNVVTRELIGEIKARNGRVCRAMLGGTGRAPFLLMGLSP